MGVWACIRLTRLGHRNIHARQGHRGQIDSFIADRIEEQGTPDRARPLVNKARKEKSLNVYEKATLRSLKKSIDQLTKIPPKLVEEFAKTTAEGNVAWKHAREKSDFSLFKPKLTKIVDLSQQMADKIGYKGHRYNALLDDYEEGFTIKDADAMFGQLLPAIKRITKKVIEDGVYSNSSPLEKVKYKEAQLKPVNEWIIKAFALPSDRFRMDVSAHPFTMSMSGDDVRLTTRYEGTDFKMTMLSTIHESGHAMYELDVDKRLEYTPIGGGVSMGVHEAQSRMWENIIGKSRSFVHFLYPQIKKTGIASRYSEEQIYKYFNVVKPSLIRVDADEITYNLHIILRYEIEKKLMAGELSVSELPSIWNDKMEKYLGIRPKNDALGVLQDVHWSHGSFGYFPAYSIGNVIGAMEMAQIEKKMGGRVWSEISRGQFNPIKAWFKDNIQKWGSAYTSRELQKRALGEAYNPKPFIRYLENKYLEK